MISTLSFQGHTAIGYEVPRAVGQDPLATAGILIAVVVVLVAVIARLFR